MQGALVAGNSMGGAVTASLAEQASQLVDRAVMIDMAPNTEDFGDGLPFLAKLGYTPVLGEAMWRLTPDFAIEDGFKEAFAPGYDMDEGFENPDQVVDDFRAMTYTSYDEAPAETDDYTDELPLDERFKQTPVPLMVIFGAEDQILDADVVDRGLLGRPRRPDRADRRSRPRPPGRKARRGRGAARRLLRPARVPSDLRRSPRKKQEDQKKDQKPEKKENRSRRRSDQKSTRRNSPSL